VRVAAVPFVFGFFASSIETTESTAFADDAPGSLTAGLCAGLIGFLLHTGIDLALFNSGAATTFFAMMAVALAVRDPGRPTSQPTEPFSRRACPASSLTVAAAGLICLALFFILLVGPAARLGRRLQVARANVEPSSWAQYIGSRSYRAYAAAIDCYRLDGTAVEEQADELIRRASSMEQIDSVIELATALRRRDPANAIAHRQLATLYRERFALGGDPADLRRAVAQMREAVAAYPTSPSRRLALAGLLEEQAALTRSVEARRSAAAELQRALDLDERRVYVSKPHRFTEEMRAGLKARIKSLQRIHSIRGFED
jgi:hypothetical protein